ncbi:E3 ubiquitin-protein ligase CCNB1IP1 [Aspergillus lentulus]|uniref:E3 ubiquitin-protein ligase CCNB1IP1 n=1 Tax=Aspergillus lentulus TaxID=293939 RepID=A0AAN6BQ92_ASPLE|nr:E3 ubiquitin-protein ligase CCNB1IP1 [Aspergillus lentulus]KAF4157035.1 hypothetical protein CNMCM6069_006204 [Aspergillus lentulus]KAF4163870.1 hypothetical protein CNMCM6936_000221 [Aspergillus lentulus]KAF4177079.1 hypothetical protein CNMCM8060_005847 [Aspergillus lentulus]KAF4185974.1 hypothetical protein CNMCM7927_006152 [Aspergillus lentulus]KAF4194371.1 hypothetical protein CNMCM8694_007757 [Aspergillus lentulus]
MDFYLRCNALKCRSQLKEQAVVTTCSHIFCLPCADTLGLSRPTHGERRCPACQTVLVNPDDAASTVLNPSEDYKTSVLSGLDPNTIMECASRALVFWAYQTTQEMCVLLSFSIDFCVDFLTGDRFYQEYLGKSLTEKYSTLNTHMDRVIHNANTEISALQAKLNDMQATEEQLRKKNQELVDLYREKCKKFAQITNLYNLLKSRAMRSQMKTAASDTVSRTLNSLGNSGNEPSVSGMSRPMGVSRPPQTPTSRQGNPHPVNLEGVEQLHRHQRSGTGSSKGAKQKVDAAVMPPPTVPVNLRNRSIPNATPQQRTRLPGPMRPSTGMSSLPQDSAMFERFHDNNMPGQYLNSGNASLSRDSLGFQRPGPGTANGAGNGSSVLRSSLFQNTII